MDSSSQYAPRIVDGTPDLQEREVCLVQDLTHFNNFCLIIARGSNLLFFIITNIHVQLNVSTEPTRLLKNYNAKKKNALSKARSHRNLDGDADEWILHLGPTTK